MNALIRKGFWIFLAFIMLAPLFVQTVSALDHLVLTGFLRSFDSKTGILRIDVSTEGCKGLREFKVPDDARDEINSKVINKQFTFQIDSATCERGRVYNIVSGGTR